MNGRAARRQWRAGPRRQRRAEPPRPFEDLHVLGALSGLATLALAWSFPLWSPTWTVLCPLHELTGIPCPTCYGTRAMLAVAHGDWWTGLRHNPLIAAAGIGLFAYIPWSAGVALGAWPEFRLAPGSVKWLVRFAATLTAANWMYLILANG